MIRKLIFLFFLLAGVGSNAWSVNAAMEKNQAEIAVIQINGTIEPGMAGFVQRSLDKAFRMDAEKVIIEIDTPGGLISAAQKMKSHIFASKVPTIAFVTGEAKSAGVLIALSAQEIYMVPGSSIGAAEPIPKTEKIVASWRSDLVAAAEARGRRTDLVAGMVDRDLVIKNIKKQGEILSLSANEAVALGIADRKANDRRSLLNDLAQRDGVHYQVIEMVPGLGEMLSWWIINPYISPILLLLGFAGLIVEAFIPGWGVGGTVGLVALGIYFGGHLITGVTGWLSLLVFALGVIAILLEIFIIPGFGAAGILGFGLIVWGIFLASTSALQAVISLSVASLGSIVLLYIMVKYLGYRGMWAKLILGTKLETSLGYTSPKKGMEKYLNLTGVALTTLRPAGKAEFNDDLVDVVSEGGYIPQGSEVKVILVEGSRVVVKAVEKTKKEEV